MAKTGTARKPQEAQETTRQTFWEYIEAPFDKTVNVERFGYARFVIREGPIKEKMSAEPRERVTSVPMSPKAVYGRCSGPWGSYVSSGFTRDDPMTQDDKALFFRAGLGEWGGCPPLALKELLRSGIDPKTIFNIDADALWAYLVKECGVVEERLPGLRWPEIIAKVQQVEGESAEHSKRAPENRRMCPVVFALRDFAIMWGHRVEGRNLARWAKNYAKRHGITLEGSGQQ